MRPSHGHCRGKTRGKSVSPEYRSWAGMVQRVENPNSHGYCGDCVDMCPAWRTDFLAFFRWVGRRPSVRHRLERSDKTKGFSPDNVDWGREAEAEAASRTRY
jgi:hypothetical protein